VRSASVLNLALKRRLSKANRSRYVVQLPKRKAL
jgi:hypothetical protein